MSRFIDISKSTQVLNQRTRGIGKALDFTSVPPSRRASRSACRWIVDSSTIGTRRYLSRLGTASDTRLPSTP